VGPDRVGDPQRAPRRAAEQPADRLTAGAADQVVQGEVDAAAHLPRERRVAELPPQPPGQESQVARVGAGELVP
jgi:hypothetical protein